MDSGDKSDFLSRKFIMAIIAIIVIVGVPLVFHANQIADSVTITVLAMVASVLTGYGIMNLKDAKLALESEANQLIASGKVP